MRGTQAIYFNALNRHFTVLGVDRQFFYLCVGFCLPIAFSARLVPSMDIVAMAVFTVLYAAGILITRIDPQMIAMYQRHIHYHRYYAAIAGIHSTPPHVKPSVPFYQGKRGLV